MSKPTPEYVRRALARIVDDTRLQAAEAITIIHHRNTAAGRLESGATLVESNDTMVSLMKKAMKQGAVLAFNTFEEVTPEGVGLLTEFGHSLADVVATPVVKWAKIGTPGSIGGIKTKMAAELKQRLELVLYAELDDFSHGMHEGERLRKEPLVNTIINNTMTDSPGGVQQAGVGNFSQSAFTQQNANLTKAIDAFLASAEFQQLGDEKRNAVGDVADALKNEAAKAEPDPKRLHRWGARLSALTKEFGLHMTATGVWHALGAIFSGSAAF